MSNKTTLDEHFGDSNWLAEFSLPESRALIDLAYLMIMVDREVTDAEMEALQSQLEKLPFANREQADRALSDHTERSRKTVADVVDDEEARRAFIEGATQRIQARDHRESVLEFLSLLSAADDYDSAETQTWVEVAKAFGVDVDDLPEYWAADSAKL